MYTNFNAILIIGTLITGYLVTILLVRQKKLSLITHRKIWNYLLACTFIVTGSLGVILAILLDEEISISWFREMLWYHVEFGIGMTIIGLFHFIWHLSYYLPKKIKTV